MEHCTQKCSFLLYFYTQTYLSLFVLFWARWTFNVKWQRWALLLKHESLWGWRATCFGGCGAFHTKRCETLDLVLKLVLKHPQKRGKWTSTPSSYTPRAPTRTSTLMSWKRVDVQFRSFNNLTEDTTSVFILAANPFGRLQCPTENCTSHLFWVTETDKIKHSVEVWNRHKSC